MMEVFSQDLLDVIAKWIKKIPKTIWVSIIATYSIGLIAHMYCFVNPLFGHDNAALFFNDATPYMCANGARWFSAYVANAFGNVELPWLEGLVTLFEYSLISWMICDLLDIRRTISRVFLSGILITSITAINSFFFLSAAHVFAFAFLLGVLSVYAFFYWKYGFIWAIFFSYFSDCTYAGYFGITVALFALVEYRMIIENPNRNFGEAFFEHFKMMVALLGAFFLTFVTNSAIVRFAGYMNNSRMDAPNNFSVDVIINNLSDAITRVFSVYWPGVDRSYFQNITVYYHLFYITVWASAFFVAYLLIKQKAYKKPLMIVLFIVDLAVFILGSSTLQTFNPFLNMLTEMHLVAPWLFFVELCELVHRFADEKIINKDVKCFFYSLLVCLTSVCTIIVGIWISNTAYMKEYNNYEAALNLLNRVVDRIEEVDGYVPGETPVILIGDTRTYYASNHEEYELVSDITGINKGGYDTAITYSFALETFIHQELNIDMNIVNSGYFITSVDKIGIFIDQTMEETGIKLNYSEIRDRMENKVLFPNKECIYWDGDVLVCML